MAERLMGGVMSVALMVDIPIHSRPAMCKDALTHLNAADIQDWCSFQETL